MYKNSKKIFENNLLKITDTHKIKFQNTFRFNFKITKKKYIFKKKIWNDSKQKQQIKKTKTNVKNI